MRDLGIVIPARNEEWLARTIQDILEHREADTEVIAVLDGQWANPEIKDHERVTLIYHSESVGQRAACNEAARVTDAKYVMKVNAHCAFDQGFDAKMLEAIDGHDDWTMVPVMRNLHVFDWVCPNGHRRYQSPSGACKECGEPTVKEVVWNPKTNPQSTSYCFDEEPHFQYFGEWKKHQEGDLVETMSLQGSCFMLAKERWFDLDICDESFGSWGSQGLEVAIKSWLSGGSVICNKRTWYGHMFRTTGGDFGFPYPLAGSQVRRAKNRARELFYSNSWPKQVRPLSWLLDKFWPVPGWTEKKRNEILEKGKSFPWNPDIDVSPRPSIQAIAPPVEIGGVEKVGLVYYTDNRCDTVIWRACQRQIDNCRGNKPLVVVSLAPVDDFGDENIVFQHRERGVLTMFQQILAGLTAMKTDYVFLVEHDVLYHPSHFSFVPPRKDVYYYDENQWAVDANDGKALFYNCMKVSMLCASRDLMLDHYRKKVQRVAQEGFTLRLGYEPGNHPPPRGIDKFKREAFWSEQPSIDIRHGKNLSPNRWSKDDFRNKRNLHAWKMADEVPGWGRTRDRFRDWLREVA